MRWYHWAWVLAAATSSPLPPVAFLFWLLLIGHVVYDAVPGSFGPVRRVIAARVEEGEEGGRPRYRLPEMLRARQEGPGEAEDAEAPRGPSRGPALLSGPPGRPDEAPEAGLSFLSLDELAAVRNILLVGSPGSGKTTLLRAVLDRRPRVAYVFDPHDHPGKWPGRSRVIGGGSRYDEMYNKLRDSQRLLVKRSQEMQAGRVEFPAFDIAGDEWGSVIEQTLAILPKDTAPAWHPGRIFIRLIKEGRKFGINVVASAHGDTVASLGVKGDHAAFLNAFDWVVYCGAFVADKAPALRPPMGVTPEGNPFPLWVVCYQHTTRRRALLDLRALPPVPAPLVAPGGPALDASTIASLLGQAAEAPALPAPVEAPAQAGYVLDEEARALLPIARRLAAAPLGEGKVGKTRAINSVFGNPSGPKYQAIAEAYDALA